MNRILMVGAALAALTAVLHTVSGTMEIHTPLLQSGLPQPIMLMLYACWHLVSVALIASAVALFCAARGRHIVSRNMTILVSSLWLGFGVVFVLVDLAFSGPAMLVTLPQWTILLFVGVLGLWGNAVGSVRAGHLQ